MYLHNYKMILISILILMNSFLMFFTNSMFNMWILMEFNSLMTFIMMFYFKCNKMMIMLYMLIQIFSSSVLVFSFYLMNTSYSDLLYLLGDLMFMSSLSLKLALFPFHSWFPHVNKGLSWPMIFLMSTFQKLAPMILMSYSNSIILLIFSMAGTVIMAAISMTYYISMKYMMSYSSLLHTTWMIMLMISSNSSFTIYFIIYLMLTFMLFMIFYKLNYTFIGQNFILSNLSSWLIFLLMLSYSSLPPFTGFILKWIGTMEMANVFYKLNLLMMVTSISAMYLYIKSTMMFMMKTTLKKWIFLKMNFIQYYMILFLLMCPLLGIEFFLMYE